jgi:DNA-binding CsgD family transcriptional regulator
MAAGAFTNPEDVRLPPDTRSVVLARLGVLNEPALKVLRVAAVAGRAMSRRLLRAISDLPADVLRNAVQECFDRQMLVAGQEKDVYRFRHALLREAVYQTTVRDIQVDLHIAMATALAADSSLCLTEGSVAAEQASHWYHAGRWPEALASAVEAGLVAGRQLAFASAEVQFSRALGLWRQVDDPDGRAGRSRVDLLARAADAARWAGHVDRAVAYIEEAVLAAPEEAGLQERLGSYLWEAGRRTDSQDAYRRAAALLDGRPARQLDLAHTRQGTVLAGNTSAALVLLGAWDAVSSFGCARRNAAASGERTGRRCGGRGRRVGSPGPTVSGRLRPMARGPRCGDRVEARLPLRVAYRLATELRAEPLRAEVDRSARRLRIDLKDRPPAAARPYELTPAEFETLQCLYDGLGTAAIARKRKVAKRTAETQLRRVYEKLDVHSAAEAITKAHREKLFD